MRRFDDERLRDVGPGTIRKLEYLNDYLTAFLRASTSVWQRGGQISYLDVFAGPGRLWNKDDKTIHDGSPLLALSLAPRIRNFVFVELDSASARSLRRHVEIGGLNERVEIIEGDCNLVIGQALSHIPVNGPAFAFVDPANLNHLRWTTVKAIAMHKGPRKIEQFILFPWDMDGNRFFTEGQDMGEIWNAAPERFDSAMPDDWRWRRVYSDLQSGRFSREQLRHRMLYLYWRGLRDLGYSHVASPKLVKSDKGRALYHLFFASDHPAGEKIMGHVLHRQPRLGESLPFRGIDDPYTFDDREAWYDELQPTEG